jgi:hypothetical protein
MRIWLALIVAPLLALESQSIAFAHGALGLRPPDDGGGARAVRGVRCRTVAFAALAWRHGRESVGRRIRSAPAPALSLRARDGIGRSFEPRHRGDVVPTWMLSPCIA